jgi:hypothetical protein
MKCGAKIEEDGEKSLTCSLSLSLFLSTSLLAVSSQGCRLQTLSKGDSEKIRHSQVKSQNF